MKNYCSILLSLRRRNGQWYRNTPVRRILELDIIPYLLTHNIPVGSAILDIGVDWYTRGYSSLFPGRHYVSLEIDRSKTRFTSKERHIWGSALSLSEHFEPASLDFILCNGVIGWGIDTEDDIQTFFYQTSHVLKPGGLLLVGWNDNEDNKPIVHPDCAANGFNLWLYQPCGSSSLNTHTAKQHIFSFYQRRVETNTVID